MNYIKTKNIILKFLLTIVILCCWLGPVNKIFASELSFYNHNTKSKVNYTGNQVSYYLNNKKINMEYPGIITSGSALADYEDLFVQGMGLSATLKDNKITITDGDTELILTIGSKTAKLNGKSKNMSVAPVKLEFENDLVKYYVPSRFVTESFGYNYVWDGSKNEARITKAFRYDINGKTMLYNDEYFSVTYINETIGFSTPVFYYNQTVYAPAKQLFSVLKCNFEYEEDTVSVSKNDIILQMNIGSSRIMINDIPLTMDAMPICITDYKTSEDIVYLPMEYCLKALGFDFIYDTSTYNYSIKHTEYTGNPMLHPDLKQYFQVNKIKVDPTPIDMYFSWIPDKSIKLNGVKNITKVCAYSVENADVLEIYGIGRDDIYDFIDNRALVIELPSVISNMDTQFYADFDVPHLNYVLMTTIGQNTKFFIMAPLEDEWAFEETEECLRIYFMSADLSLDDLLVFKEERVIVEKQESELQYPDNQFIIPLPEGYNLDNISLQDDYLNKNIKIFLSGNMVDYFKNNPPTNPYEFVDDIEIVYKEDKNQTIITCHTKYICGFEKTTNDKFIAIRIAKPSEIYDKIVVLDAGHGGKDPGAVYGNIYEKNITLNIIKLAESLFKNCDIQVYCTRTSDKYLSLSRRANFAKEVDADLFVSLHMNASSYSSVSGTEVYYSTSNNNATKYGLTSKKMAQIFVGNLSESIDTCSRGTLSSNFYVVKYNSVPAVLVELGFLTNEKERSKLTDKNYQQKAAKALYESIIEIFSAYPTVR